MKQIIQQKEQIFYRNFQEIVQTKKSLGLGLSMVRSICEKYNIKYSLHYHDNQNIFSYELQKLDYQE